MGESKHTPGPWEWVTDGQRGEYFDGALRGQFGDAGAIYPILNVRLGEIEAATVSVHEANARLIAAAPQMLGALRRGLAWLTLPPGATLSEASIESAKNALREGIEAATGGEP